MDDLHSSCPNGHPVDLPTRFAWEGPSGEAGWDVLESCPHCARDYAAQLWAARSVREHLRRSLTSGQTGKSVSGVGRVLRLRPWAAVAAALILALTGVAAGSLIPWHRLYLVSGASASRVTGLEARGFDLDGLDVPGTGDVHSERAFELGPAEMGTLFAVSRSEGAGLLLCGFDARGRRIWSSDEHWPDARLSVGAEKVRFQSLKPLVTPTPNAALEDCALLLTTRSRRSCVTLFDPADGHRYWTLFADCNFVFRDSAAEPLQTLPAADRVVRPVLLAGAIGEGLRARPVLLLVGSEGKVTQQIVFPVFEKGREPDVHVTALRVNWRLSPPRVTAETSEGLHFHMEFVGGRLALSSPALTLTGNFESRRVERFGEPEFERMIDDLGGRTIVDGQEAWLGGLTRLVEQPAYKTATGW